MGCTSSKAHLARPPQLAAFSDCLSSADPSRVLLADQVIGHGTRGTILAASRRSTGTPVAVKLISALVDDGPRGAGLELDAVLETLHEVRLLRQLADAPCIIQCHEVMWARNELWLVLEVADGGGLGDYMGVLGRGLTDDEAQAIMHNLVTALTACHAARIIHRDVKADNILIVNGVAKLADFGISYAHSQAVGLRRRPKSFRGSAYWMSPEVAVLSDPLITDQEYTATVDCWAAGCTLIELVEGEPPLYRLDPMDAVNTFAAMATADGGPPPRLQASTAVSDEARSFQEACCTVSGPQRPSAQELLTYDWLAAAPDQAAREAIVTTLATAYKVARNVAEPSATPSAAEPLADASTAAIRMDSWLLKQGKQRFFVQLDHMLYWFAAVPTGERTHDNLARQSSNSLDLRLYRVAVSRPSTNRAAVSLVLQPVSAETSAKAYILDADRRELCERWITSIAAASPESVPLKHELSEASLEAVHVVATRRITTKAAEAARRTGAQVSAAATAATHEGWLDKLGGRSKWQARYFRLTNEKLSWHSTDTPGAATKNAISLIKDRVVIHAPTVPELRRARQRKARVTFALEGLNKTYLLSGEGTAVTRWVEELGRNAELLHVGAEALEYLAAGDYEAAERASRAALNAAAVQVSGVVGGVEKVSKDDILASFGVTSPEELMNKMSSDPALLTPPDPIRAKSGSGIRPRSPEAGSGRSPSRKGEARRFRSTWLTVAGRREFIVLDRKKHVMHRFSQDPRLAVTVDTSGRSPSLWSAVRAGGGDLGVVDLWDYGPAVLQRGQRTAFILPELVRGGGGSSGSRLLGMSERRGPDPRRAKPVLHFTAETADDASAWLMELAKLSFSGGGANYSDLSMRTDSGNGPTPPHSTERTIRSPRDAMEEMRQFQSSLDVLSVPTSETSQRSNRIRVRSSEGRNASAGSVAAQGGGSHVTSAPLVRSASTAVVPSAGKKRSPVSRSAAAAAAAADAAPMKRTKPSRRKKRAKDPMVDA